MKSFSTLVFAFIIVSSFTFFSCSGGLSNKAVKARTQRLVDHEGYATIALVHNDYNNKDEDISDITDVCSGVWVDDTHILTAQHCIVAEQELLQDEQDKKEKEPKECGLFQTLFGGGCATPKHKVIELDAMPVHYIQWNEVDDMGKEPTAWHLAKVVTWDKYHDLALLEAQGHAIPKHEVAKVAKEAPALAEHIQIVGHPTGYYWTFLQGTVAGYRGDIPGLKERGGPWMQVQSPIYYGNSGGGAFNDDGELVGIADRLDGMPSSGLLIHVDTIRTFLQDHDILPGGAPSSSKEKKEVKSIDAGADASTDAGSTAVDGSSSSDATGSYLPFF